jgi:hypothetical protein
MKDGDDVDEAGSVLLSFRASRALANLAQKIAAKEGLSRSAVARRALLRDLAAQADAGR